MKTMKHGKLICPDGIPVEVWRGMWRYGDTSTGLESRREDRRVCLFLPDCLT